jgi:ELWxxDGT repeat protein
MDTNLGQVELVKDINPDGDSYPDSLVEFNDKLYFAANDGETGRALFVSDGTTEGTQLVTDIYPENNSTSRFYFSKLSNLTEFNDKLYFASDNGESGRELFVSDGTTKGTQLVKDIYPGEGENGYKNASSPFYLTEFDGKLYFTAQGDANDEELFVSDGTAKGTQLLVDLDQSEGEYDANLLERQFGDFNTRKLLEFNDKLYFKANDGVHGEELFVSDGTAEGTQLVADINQETSSYGYSYGSSPSDLVEFNDKLYFAANDGVHGRELFVSDGTAEGTQLLVDLREETDSDSYGSSPRELVEFNDKLYFAAYDGESRELYVSDGTAEGTQLLDPGKDQDGNGYVSDPDNLVEFNDKLYFTADDGENGYGLFVSDGTGSATQLGADIDRSSRTANLTVFGDELFFAADNGEAGTELYKLTLDDSTGEPQVLITGSDGADNLSGTDSAEEIQALSGQDTVNGGKGNDTIDGGDGDDHLNGNPGNDSLLGGNGNDTLTGDGGNDYLNGGNGSDVLNAGNGSDLLTGGEDNDRLDGGIGNDTLDGGNGDDTFVLRMGDGSNTIVDFNLGGLNGIGGDQLGLADGLQFTDLTFAGNNILVGEEVLATLEGVNTEELNASDFSVI